MCTLVTHNNFLLAEEPVETVTLRVTTVNPSKKRTQLVPVKIDLPVEVTARDIIDLGGLNMEYDSKRGIYYVFNNSVELKPLETRVFAIEIKDVWLIPDDRLEDLGGRTQDLIKLLDEAESPRLAEAQKIAAKIVEDIAEIERSQEDEAVSKETHIGIYRSNLIELENIKEDVARIERMVVSVPGPPVPEPVEDLETPKTQAPSKATTWIVIFIIIVFIGLLAGIFFFTWHRQEQMTENLFTKTTDSAFKQEDKGGGGS